MNKISSMRLRELKTMTSDRSVITLNSDLMGEILDELISLRPIEFELTAHVEEIYTAGDKKYYVLAGIQSHLEMVRGKKVRVHITELK
jgi:hypothetical protein